MLAKAQRGEFHVKLPIGLIYDAEGQVVLHPDAQVSDTVRLFFKSFSRIGTACGVVKHFKEKGLLFPKSNSMINNNDIIWGRLDLSRAVQILHNPRYAGACRASRFLRISIK
jgi:DNA invertase Pin-like site-specific DNA recombinase